jgi:serine/threonine protein kinase
MSHTDRMEIDTTSPPFDQFRNIARLAADRGGRGSGEHARHQLYAAFDERHAAHVLIKLTSKPGAIYQQNLSNEIASLSTINRELPTSPYFPSVRAHGRLRDGRVYLVTSLFDEFPLATTIGTERVPARTVAHLRTSMEVARALEELHGCSVFHVDLNPMNILYRSDKGRPIIRIVDFESSYEKARHGAGVFYDPPTTPGFSAPEVSRQAPDARSDIFSFGAVLYTLLAGYGWTWEGDLSASVGRDLQLDPELKDIVLSAVNADPDRRFRTVAEFHATLSAHLERIWPGRSW